jgi:hypothetical protein
MSCVLPKKPPIGGGGIVSCVFWDYKIETTHKLPPNPLRVLGMISPWRAREKAVIIFHLV